MGIRWFRLFICLLVCFFFMNLHAQKTAALYVYAPNGVTSEEAMGAQTMEPLPTHNN